MAVNQVCNRNLTKMLQPFFTYYSLTSSCNRCKCNRVVSGVSVIAVETAIAVSEITEVAGDLL